MQIQELKKSLEVERKELNDCRAEITSLKMHIEGFRANSGWIGADNEQPLPSTIESYKAEIKSLQIEIEKLKENAVAARNTGDPVDPQSVSEHAEEEVVEIHEDKVVVSHAANLVSRSADVTTACPTTSDVKREDPKDLRLSSEVLRSYNSYSSLTEYADNVESSETTFEERNHPSNNDTLKGEKCSEKTVIMNCFLKSHSRLGPTFFLQYEHFHLKVLQLAICAAGFGNDTDPFRCFAKNRSFCTHKSPGGLSI